MRAPSVSAVRTSFPIGVVSVRVAHAVQRGRLARQARSPPRPRYPRCCRFSPRGGARVEEVVDGTYRRSVRDGDPDLRAPARARRRRGTAAPPPGDPAPRRRPRVIGRRLATTRCSARRCAPRPVAASRTPGPRRLGGARAARRQISVGRRAHARRRLVAAPASRWRPPVAASRTASPLPQALRARPRRAADAADPRPRAGRHGGRSFRPAPARGRAVDRPLRRPAVRRR